MSPQLARTIKRAVIKLHVGRLRLQADTNVLHGPSDGRVRHARDRAGRVQLCEGERAPAGARGKLALGPL